MPLSLGETLKKGQASDRNMEGWFYAFHGSNWKESHFAVRAIKIERDADGLLAVQNLLQDAKSLHDGLLKASRFLSFVDGNPHILTYHKDNARRCLFIGEQVSPLNGSVIESNGPDDRYDEKGQPFHRAMLLLRLPRGMAEKEIVARQVYFS